MKVRLHRETSPACSGGSGSQLSALCSRLSTFIPLPIIRTGAGGFFGFGEFKQQDGTSFQGRFAQILPPNPSTPAHQTKALALLAALGVTAEALRHDWSAN